MTLARQFFAIAQFRSWSVVHWLEQGKRVQKDSAKLATKPDLPAAPEVIASCDRRVAVWSDPGVNRSRREKVAWLAKELRERFGGLHYDHFALRWIVSDDA